MESKSEIDGQENSDGNKKIDLTPDVIFSFFVHKTEVLSRLLKDNITELGDLEPEEIKKFLDCDESNPEQVNGRETIYKTPDRKRIELDSVFDVRIPGKEGKEITVIVGVEGQNNPYPGYPIINRASFYLGTMIAAQKGTVFNGNNYGKLRNTYSIWCMLDPKHVDQNTVISYGLVRKKPKRSNSSFPKEIGFFNLVFLNVGEYKEGLPTALETADMLFSKMDGESRKELVQNNLNITLSDEELEGLEKMSTLAQDKYDHGYYVGHAEGKMESSVSNVLSAVRFTGKSVDYVLDMLGIASEIRPEVKKRVEEQLSSEDVQSA